MIEWIPLTRAKTGLLSDLTYITRDLTIGDIKRLWAKYNRVNPYMVEVSTSDGMLPDHSLRYMAMLNRLDYGEEMIFKEEKRRRFRQEFITEDSGDEEDEGIVIEKADARPQMSSSIKRVRWQS